MIFLRTVGNVSHQFCNELARWCEEHDHRNHGREYNAEMRKNLAKYLSRKMGFRITPAQALDVARSAYSKTKQAA